MQDLFNRLVRERDIHNLITCTIEEMSELTKVLCKYERNSEKYSIEAFAEEVSHVRLMCAVLCERFKVSVDTVELYQEDALKRCFKEVV